MSGVFAYVIQQRRREIGIRMALGAPPAHVIRLVLSGTMRAALVGLAAGFVCAIGVWRLLARFLYGVSPFDPLAYCAVSLALLLAAIAASYLPARRAISVDPMTALRYY
jgi:ABC-type lipoprotein release transport system permease subunit